MRLPCVFAVLLLLVAGCVTPKSSGPDPPASSSPAFAPICTGPTEVPPDGGACVIWLGEEGTYNLEASLAVNPLDPDNVLVAWTVRDDVMVGSARVDSTAGVVAALTYDGGQSWVTTRMHDPSVPDGPGRTRYAWDERAGFLPDGTPIVLFGGTLSTIATSGAVDGDFRITLAKTTDRGASWSYHHVVETRTSQFDFFAMAVSPEGTVYAATVERTIGGLRLWSSLDQGETWRGPTVVVPTAYGPGGANLQPSLDAGPDGFVALSTISTCFGCPTLPPEVAGITGDAVWLSHDGGATFGAPIEVAGLEQSTLLAPGTAIDLRGPTPRLHHILATTQGTMTDAVSTDLGKTWTQEPFNATLGPAPWAMIAVGPDGAAHALVRHGGAAAWNIAWLVREADGSTDARHLASADRQPRLSSQSNQLLGAGNFSDDYGGLAVATDGVVWMAFADPRASDHARIAVVRMARASGDA